jgi:hypothetical protein
MGFERNEIKMYVGQLVIMRTKVGEIVIFSISLDP